MRACLVAVLETTFVFPKQQNVFGHYCREFGKVFWNTKRLKTKTAKTQKMKTTPTCFQKQVLWKQAETIKGAFWYKCTVTQHCMRSPVRFSRRGWGWFSYLLLLHLLKFFSEVLISKRRRRRPKEMEEQIEMGFFSVIKLRKSSKLS
jgi:hypothetical protein